ncbi:MAG TPA: RHS repeat-associated core domain-containing protein [Candidatus Angelobacter sp.]|jgi:RHS repeat-associated protein
MTNDGLGHAFTYDGEGRISQINSGAVQYTYDPEMGRVRKDVSGQPSTEYYYFGSEVVAEQNVSTSAWTNYVFFDGERVARREYPAGNVFYYFSDHLKTASVITDASGTIKSESDYYPWGGELQFTANDSNHYKFTGKERDTESGLDDFGARYYSDWLGRFITPDWAAKATAVPYAVFGDPQTLNLYSYVRNNPITKADLDGHCDWCQSLKNFVTFNGWNTDDELKQKEQEYDKSVRIWLVNQYGLNPKDVAQLTPKQADKLSDALDAGKGGVTVDGVKIVVQAAAQAAAVVPTTLSNTLSHIDKTGSAPSGQQGGGTWANDGRGGGQVLPKTDASGKAITYREWDVNPQASGVNRGSERLVTGSDGSAYYTNDHYSTFTKVR